MHRSLARALQRQARASSWGYAPSSFDLGPRKLPDGLLDKDVADYLRWTLGTVQHVRVGQQRSAALAAALKSELERLREAGYQIGPQAHTQAITLLARWGRNVEARVTLEEAKRKGMIESAEPYEELMKGHAMCGDLHGIQQVIREMHQAGWKITKQAYNYLLMGFSKRGEQSHALSILEAMKDSGLQPDRMSYHWTIMACNNYTAARRVFDDMIEKGIQFNDQTFSALLKTCVKAGDAANGMAVLVEAISDGLKPSSTVFNQVMRLHLKPLDMNAVASLYRKMREIRIPPDFVTYCIFIRACKLECRGGIKVDGRAISLAEAGLEQARRDGTDHREVYRELLSLYNKVGDRKKAEEIANVMLKALPGDNRTIDTSPTVWA
ncbi:Pentatricopeptide repeat-containing protein [Diplonema papillatum]|nr:Pentatricopeptide repeat-containing protein [Diplonema papillatum]